MIENNLAIECINLEKSFGKKPVLQNINFKIKSGTILAVVGPNGAGKTTLLKILATLITPSAGNALVCGEDVNINPLTVKKMIGFVSSEERSFFWRLSGRQNLNFFAALHKIDKTESNNKIDALLRAVGLGEKGHVRFREYSTGMKQALGISRGMLHDPLVLLMDEPTRSLSPDVASTIRELINHKVRHEGKTVLISSHNLKEVEDMADRIAIIHQGAIKAIGTLSELRTHAGFSQPADLDAIFKYFTHEDKNK